MLVHISIYIYIYAMLQGRRRETELDLIFICAPHFALDFNLFAVPTDFSSI